MTPMARRKRWDCSMVSIMAGLPSARSNDHYQGVNVSRPVTAGHGEGAPIRPRGDEPGAESSRHAFDGGRTATSREPDSIEMRVRPHHLGVSGHLDPMRLAEEL